MRKIWNKKLLFVLYFIIILLFFTMTGCTKRVTVTEYRTVTYTDTEKVPEEYIDYEIKQVSVKKPEYCYELRKPYFPVSNTRINIALLPFTSSVARKGSGDEVYGELEYQLLKRAEFFQTSEKIDLKKMFDNATVEYGKKSNLFSDWLKNNQAKRYRILNRDQFKKLLEEKNLNQNAFNENRNQFAALIGVDGIITGHVKELEKDNTSFIIKFISAKSGEIIFSQRYEDTYEKAFKKAVDDFYFALKRSRSKDCFRIVMKNKKEKVTKTRYIDKKVEKTREEPYTTYKTVKDTEAEGWLLLLIILGIISA
jgi:hypothetical protein